MKNPDVAVQPGRPGAVIPGNSRIQFEESAPHMVWVAQPDGWVDYFNNKWLDYTGQKFQDALGWGWKQSIHWKDLKTVIDKWKNSIVTATPLETEIRVQGGKDKSYKWFLLRACPSKDSNDKVVRWVGTFTDIDNQHKQLEKKDEFIGIASHELRTPLASIQAYVELLERSVDSKKSPDIKTYVDKAHRQIRILNRLIADLLDVSEINAGKLRMTYSEFVFGDLLTEVIENFSLTNKTHSIIRTGDANLLVKADKQRLDQVITALIANAVKYSPKSDKVVVNVTHDRKHVMVAITDFGIGIPPERLKKIFNRFYRADDNTKYTGLGIGLYISCEIINRLKGRIWAESTLGEGSTFYFTIPYKRVLSPGRE